jgi:hypothetical protein
VTWDESEDKRSESMIFVVTPNGASVQRFAGLPSVNELQA